nr:immunoglobulin light chain junction region [Macaca mulatta]MOX34386.1 immunoglobulin light chain junction region [Macaca mulatta]MOX34448.1 immunoglobulin light chain junction region [Macaca mulatta]MOX34611.1 immunoglobulin light chain junction region [Macaca mulatta]MOX34640.1 immunoglobulin light chain junction region [Macaca mulatta]
DYYCCSSRSRSTFIF